MQIVFHPDAEDELHAAIDFYYDIERNLAYDFNLEMLLPFPGFKVFHRRGR